MQKIQDHIAQLVEDNTRFSVDAIEVVEEQQNFSATVTAVFGGGLHYSASPHQGPRSLPQQIDSFPTPEAAKADALRRIELAEAQSEQAIQRWIDTEGAKSYQRFMPPQAGFLQNPGLVGSTFRCESCNGQGRFRCGSCEGDGKTKCTTCNGTYQRRCSHCNGTTYLACTSCNGGSYALPKTYNGGGQSGCSTCGGSGKSYCMLCNSGKIGCNCNIGYVTCSNCHGNGQIACDGCASTGQRHLYWQVECEVRSMQDLVTPKQMPAVVQQTLAEHIGLDQLRDFGNIRETDYQVALEGQDYRIHFPVDFTWADVQLRIQGHHYHLYAYGDQRKVFDYQNIVGNLLQGDLDRLNTAVQQTGWFSFNSTALAEQLRQFSSSEMNLRIADAAAQGIRESTPELEGNGLVSKSYVNNSLALLSQSFGKLLNPHLLNQTVVMIFLCGLLSGGLTVALAYRGSGHWLQPVGYSVFAGVVLWLFGEYRSRRKISALFATESRARITASLRASKAMRTWRIVGALCLMIATLTIHLATKNHAWVLQKTTETSHINNQLKRANYYWKSSHSWAYDDYGDPEVLKQYAHGPHFSERPHISMAYAAWLLTRPDTSTAHIQEARQILQRLPPEIHADWHWSTLTALADYKDPATQSQGLSQLLQAAEQGHREALFALSKHYAKTDPALSLRYLSQAAEKHQHEASYEMGMRYLEGRGVRKDLAKAKAHMLPLVLSNVPGAQEAARKVIGMR